MLQHFNWAHCALRAKQKKMDSIVIDSRSIIHSIDKKSHTHTEVLNIDINLPINWAARAANRVCESVVPQSKMGSDWMPHTAKTMCLNSFYTVLEWLALITRPETDVNLLLCGLQRTESIAHMVPEWLLVFWWLLYSIGFTWWCSLDPNTIFRAECLASWIGGRVKLNLFQFIVIGSGQIPSLW